MAFWQPSMRCIILLDMVFWNVSIRMLCILNCSAQRQIKVYFKGKEVGVYYADIVLNDCIILELKANECLCPEHEAQLLNYLKSTDIEIGLLLNFGEHPQVRRKIFTNDRKENLCQSVQSV